jgi:membrane protein YdbS with pleckstrin-like domain
MSDGDRATTVDDGEASGSAAGEEAVERSSDGPPDGERAGGDGVATAGEDAGGAATLDPSEIDISELVGPERTLEPRIRWVWLLRSALAALVLGAVVGAVSVALDAPVWVGPAVFTVLFALGVTRAFLRYRSWSYRVRADSLFLDRGVLTRVRTVVPYVRIQHVDASRGPVERTFGLATVVVYTAGSRGADVSIPGLTPEDADDLQERLKRLAIAAEGEDAV